MGQSSLEWSVSDFNAMLLSATLADVVDVEDKNYVRCDDTNLISCTSLRLQSEYSPYVVEFFAIIGDLQLKLEFARLYYEQIPLLLHSI